MRRGWVYRPARCGRLRPSFSRSCPLTRVTRALARIERFRHRRYSQADLDVLSRAQTLLESGLSYAAAREQLGLPSREVTRARQLASNRSVRRARPPSNRTTKQDAPRAQELAALAELASQATTWTARLAGAMVVLSRGVRTPKVRPPALRAVARAVVGPCSGG